jgi:hypothetical protein
MIQFKRYTKMLICSAGLLSAALLTACGSGDQNRDPILGLPSATLVSVAVTLPLPRSPLAPSSN